MNTAVFEAQDVALDLHALYRRNATCGYSDDLTFSASEVQSMAARLRGITAISGLLIATRDREEIAVGAWLQSGLVEALHALAEDVQDSIEHRSTLTQKAKEAACATA